MPALMLVLLILALIVAAPAETGAQAPWMFNVPVSGAYTVPHKADGAFYVFTQGEWHISPVDRAPYTVIWGGPSDVPCQADYEGSGRLNICAYRVPTGEWFIIKHDGSLVYAAWGAALYDDTPAPSDYEGVGRANIAIFRRVTKQFFIIKHDGTPLVLP